MANKIFIKRTCMFFAALLCTAASYAYEPDAIPSKAKAEKISQPAAEIVLPTAEDLEDSELTLDNLYKALDKEGVKFPKIVAAQALLETGNFGSKVCLELNNLFGLRRPSDGSYYAFNNWEESVVAYRDYVQYKYTDGDYYRFLKQIGYAEDKHYVEKVKRIADNL